MSALFVVSHSSSGGAQELWVNIAEAFRECGFHTKLLALYPSKDSKSNAVASAGWEYASHARPDGILGWLKIVFRVWKYLRKNAPDTIYTAQPAVNVLVPLLVYLSRCGATVVTCHHVPVSTYGSALRFFDSLMGRMGVVSSIVCVSNSVAQSLSKFHLSYRAKVVVIKNALPEEIESHIEAISQARKTSATHDGTVVAVGRLASQKNYSTLLKAAANLPGVHFNIVGDGPLREELAMQSQELGLTARVTFWGHTPRKQALEIMATSAVFVQVSEFEGHSLGLIEASKLSLPLVVSDTPSQLEGITAYNGRICGITVPVYDHLSLAQSIKKVLDEPNYRDALRAVSKILADESRFKILVQSYHSLGSFENLSRS